MSITYKAITYMGKAMKCVCTFRVRTFAYALDGGHTFASRCLLHTWLLHTWERQ